MKIIYLDGNNVVVVNPVIEWVDALGIEFIANKDVPKDVSYKIIPDSIEIPATPEEYSAIQSSGGVGGDFGNGSNWAVTAYTKDDTGKIDALLVNSLTGAQEVIANI